MNLLTKITNSKTNIITTLTVVIMLLLIGVTYFAEKDELTTSGAAPTIATSHTQTVKHNVSAEVM